MESGFNVIFCIIAMINNKTFYSMLLCIMGLYGTSIQVVAQGADQDYIAIYKVIKQADQFKETGLSEQAAQLYASAAKS